jgi:hypothetical protein
MSELTPGQGLREARLLLLLGLLLLWDVKYW